MVSFKNQLDAEELHMREENILCELWPFLRSRGVLRIFTMLYFSGQRKYCRKCKQAAGGSQNVLSADGEGVCTNEKNLAFGFNSRS